MSVEVGQVVKGTVEDVRPFGAFIRLESGERGLVHVSEIAHRYVRDVAEYLKVGDQVQVMVIAVKEKSKIDLSIKRLSEPPKVAPEVRDESFEEKLSHMMKQGSDRLSDWKKHNTFGKKKNKGRK
jgi:S1 RNA binding domain protein